MYNSRITAVIIITLFLALFIYDIHAAYQPLASVDVSQLYNPVNTSDVFEHSDVCISSRFAQSSVIDIIRLVAANKLLWVYGGDAKFMQQVKEAGIDTYQTTVNSLIEGQAPSDAFMLDYDGKRIVPPWMVWNPPGEGCANRPLYLQYVVDQVNKAVDSGANMVQFDDWALNYGANNYSSSCFCADCMRNFNNYLRLMIAPNDLKQLDIYDIDTFNYRKYLASHYAIKSSKEYITTRDNILLSKYYYDFQRYSVAKFFAKLRSEIDSHNGRHIPISINYEFFSKPLQKDNFAINNVDFALGETEDMSLASLSLSSKIAEALGKWQVFSPVPLKNVPYALTVAPLRRSIANSYALGQLMLVPWDIYMGNYPDRKTQRPRYYGAPSDYGDVYKFISNNKRLFNGYATLGTVVLLINLDNFDKSAVIPLINRLLAQNVPFRIETFGSRYYQDKISIDNLTHSAAILLLDDKSSIPALQRPVVNSINSNIRTFYVNNLTQQTINDLAPFWINNVNVKCFPRVKESDPKKLVLHLIDQDNYNSHENTGNVVIVMKNSWFKNIKVSSVKFNSISNVPDKVFYTEIKDGIKIVIPSFKLWGILEIQIL